MGRKVAIEHLHFHRVCLHIVITGRNCHLNWQIKQRMSGIDVEPLVPPSTIDSETERSVATWREERRLEGQVTWKLTSASHPLSILWSALCLPLPSLFLSALFFLPPALDLVLDLCSPSPLSLRLFPLAFSLSALLPWLQHHLYMKCICVPGMGPKGLVGLRTGWLYMTGCGGIMGTPPI